MHTPVANKHAIRTMKHFDILCSLGWKSSSGLETYNQYGDNTMSKIYVQNVQI